MAAPERRDLLIATLERETLAHQVEALRSAGEALVQMAQGLEAQARGMRARASHLLSKAVDLEANLPEKEHLVTVYQKVRVRDEVRIENDDSDPDKPLVDFMVRRVAEQFDTTIEGIMGPTKTNLVVRPRSLAMVALARCGMSLPKIGRHFRRDHTTVHHAIKSHEARMKGDPVYREAARRLAHALKAMGANGGKTPLGSEHLRRCASCKAVFPTRFVEDTTCPDCVTIAQTTATPMAHAAQERASRVDAA